MTKAEKRPDIPFPAEIRVARMALGLTQRECAEICRVALRTWQGWEDPGGKCARRMSKTAWELWRLKTARMKPKPEPDPGGGAEGRGRACQAPGHLGGKAGKGHPLPP
jgi:hypothetical protein